MSEKKIESRFLRLQDASRMTGIPIGTLSHWCLTGQLPGIKLAGGKLWYIDILTLEKKLCPDSTDCPDDAD